MTEEEYRERSRRRAEANAKLGRYEEPPELTAEDEAALDQAWATLAQERAHLSKYDDKDGKNDDRTDEPAAS